MFSHVPDNSLKPDGRAGSIYDIFPMNDNFLTFTVAASRSDRIQKTTLFFHRNSDWRAHKNLFIRQFYYILSLLHHFVWRGVPDGRWGGRRLLMRGAAKIYSTNPRKHFHHSNRRQASRRIDCDFSLNLLLLLVFLIEKWLKYGEIRIFHGQLSGQ